MEVPLIVDKYSFDVDTVLACNDEVVTASKKALVVLTILSITDDIYIVLINAYCAVKVDTLIFTPVKLLTFTSAIFVKPLNVV